MEVIYDASDYNLCMNACIRIFRRNGSMDLFHIIERFFHKYISYISDSTISCTLRDLQPESIEGEEFTKETWKEVLPLHDFLLSVLISRKFEEEKSTPEEWILSNVAINTECIGGRFKNQTDFKAWTKNRDFALQYPFIDSDVFEIDDGDVLDFNALLLSMLEYSAPRATYMPVACSNLIGSNIGLISEETRKEMISVIEETAGRFEEYGKEAGGWTGIDPCIIKLKDTLTARVCGGEI